MIDYNRHILSLSDVELEKLVREWVSKRTNSYDSVNRFAGAGDMGRDVVGFYTAKKHEGAWDNYQCKQYNKSLPTDTSMLEIGKIIYFSHRGNFTLPKNYFFVAPRGVNRNLEKYIYNPSEFKSVLINEWDKYCRDNITSTETVHLTMELRAQIDLFDFNSIKVIDLDTITTDESFRAILVNWFGGELSASPIPTKVPKKIQKREAVYVEEILAAYSEKDKITYSSHQDILTQPNLEIDFDMQRERFFSTDAFKRLYRDNTFQSYIEDLEKQILHGVFPSIVSEHANGYERMCNTLSEAAKIKPTGTLSPRASIVVKQGYCHHFVNGKKFKWIK